MNWSDEAAFRIEALNYLKNALPEADLWRVDEDWLNELISYVYSACRDRAWCREIPDDIFLPFVLFPRVNNENLELYHPQIQQSLLPRLGADMTMEQAVLAVNRWCFEQATYQSTDDRTASALTVMRRGFGRCGEETVLLVSALRACGIPARQMYAPMWSHCDDNHAWVEAWTDGRWRYLGACEPELSLDSGWFTAAASKAIMVHTRAFGRMPAGERAEGREGTAWVINRTAAYARTALLTLRVTKGGRPLPDVRTVFELANMAAWHPICEKVTDEAGTVQLLTGLGTLHIALWEDDVEYELIVDTEAQTEYEVDLAALKNAPLAEYRQRPPRESRIQAATEDESAAAALAEWMASAEAARQARFDKGPSVDALCRVARGNAEVIARFLSLPGYDMDDKRRLLESLTEKDLSDITEDVLIDALEGALPFKGRCPEAIWESGVLCPRVGNETLAPERKRFREALPAGAAPEEIWRLLTERVKLHPMPPKALLPGLFAAYERSRAPREVMDMIFVAACRAVGIPARLHPVTGVKEVWREGSYSALLENERDAASLILVNRSPKALVGGVHFSVALRAEEEWRLLNLNGVALEDALTLPLPAGKCRVMHASRQIDGRLNCGLETISLRPGDKTSVEIRLMDDPIADLLTRCPLAPLRVGKEGAVLPGDLRGHAAIVALVAPGQEPTEHFFNELLDARERLSRTDASVWLIYTNGAQRKNAKLQRVLEALPQAVCVEGADDAALRAWRRALNAGELRLPLAVAVGRSGEGLFAFTNYHVGSVMTLLDILSTEEN